MTANTPCAAPAKSCGTPSGWRAGGRCWRCRTAHNAETNRHRGLTPQQRATVLDALRAGAPPESAADAVGLSRARLGAQVTRDGEMRAALDGHDLRVQRAARLADYLAALARTGGDIALAVEVSWINREERDRERAADDHFRTAEDAVMAMTSGKRPQLAAPRPLPPHRRSLTEAEARDLHEREGDELGHLVHELSHRRVHLGEVASELGLSRHALGWRLKQYRRTGRWPGLPATSSVDRAEKELRAMVEELRERGHECLPSKQALKEQLGCGSSTFDAAMERLESDGLVVRRPSIGIFVVPRPRLRTR